MEALQALPGWAQFFLALIVGGLLLLLNVGWLMQARSWLEAAKQKQQQRRRGSTSVGTGTGTTSRTAGEPTSPSPHVNAKPGGR